MAITFVGATSGGAINGGDATITLPGTYSAGDYSIVGVTLATSKAATLSVTSSSGDAYTQIVTTIDTSNTVFGVFRRLIVSTGETQITVTGTAGASDTTTGIVMIFDGVHPYTPEDVTPTSTNGASATPDSPSITVVSCSDVIITAVGFGTTLTAVNPPTPPSSFLNPTTANSTDTNSAKSGMAWITNATTAAFNPAAWTSTASVTWASATIALRPNSTTSLAWNVSFEFPTDLTRIIPIGY